MKSTLQMICIGIKRVPFISPLPPPPEALGIANVDYYYYLNQSGTYTVDGTDDKKEFDDTVVSPGVRVQRS